MFYEFLKSIIVHMDINISKKIVIPFLYLLYTPSEDGINILSKTVPSTGISPV